MSQVGISNDEKNKDGIEKAKKVEVPFPKNFKIEKVNRTIFADKPRITYIQL